MSLPVDAGPDAAEMQYANAKPLGSVTILSCFRPDYRLGSGLNTYLKHAVSDSLEIQCSAILLIYQPYHDFCDLTFLNHTESLCCAPFIVLDIVTLAGRAYTSLPFSTSNIYTDIAHHDEDPHYPRYYRFSYLRYFFVGCADEQETGLWVT